MEESRDCELVARLREGDPGAFDAIFDRYRARLYSFLVRLSGRSDVAEDLLQETWIRLATRVSCLREDVKLAPWLFAVARNLYRSHWRSTMSAANRVVEFARQAGGSGLRCSPFEAMVQDECQRRIEHALASLPTNYREVLLLVSVEGMSPSEAAGICRLSPAALRKRLSRARMLLAGKLHKPARQAPANAKSAFPAGMSVTRGKIR